MEEARREKEATKAWLYKTPFQPEIISNFNRILLGTVPKLNIQILEAQDDLQRMIDLGSDYGDKEVSPIMLRKAKQLENFTWCFNSRLKEYIMVRGISLEHCQGLEK